MSDHKEQGLLQVENLTIEYSLKHKSVQAIQDVSFSIRPGEVVSIVGESGSGKSTLGLALQGLLPENAEITSGEIHFDRDRLDLFNEAAWKSVRGTRIAYIPQDPTTSLNPVKRNGPQVGETLVAHRLATKRSVTNQALKALSDAGIEDATLRYGQYPNELSGGLKQRVLIAGAIIASPTLIIADEPTSGLDVTVQKQILDHIESLVHNNGSSMILITHDLSVALDRSDRVIVMKNGRIVETGTTEEIFTSPKDPYTSQLLGYTPQLAELLAQSTSDDKAGEHIVEGEKLLEVRNLGKEFTISRRKVFNAVKGVSFSLSKGETLALVGESGSGKTTTSRIIAGLEEPSSGEVLFDGKDLSHLTRQTKRDHWRKVQMVYQNPFDSLDPKFTVQRILEEPLKSYDLAPRGQHDELVAQALDSVSLPLDFRSRRPRELSGGQRQRVAIARALIVKPQLVVLDEPVSALDATVQRQVLDLLKELKHTMNISFLFITHDLSLLPGFADNIVVLQDGLVKEKGAVSEVYRSPQDKYTQKLLSAIPGRRFSIHS